MGVGGGYATHAGPRMICDPTAVAAPSLRTVNLNTAGRCWRNLKLRILLLVPMTLPTYRYTTETT
jgi:hypothetical protein